MADFNDDLNDFNEQKKNTKYLTIEGQRESFRQFSMLPISIGVLVLVLFLLLGVMLAVMTKNFGPFAGMAIAGLLCGGVLYWALKVIISSQVMTVLYLEKINDQLERISDMIGNTPIEPTDITNPAEPIDAPDTIAPVSSVEPPTDSPQE